MTLTTAVIAGDSTSTVLACCPAATSTGSRQVLTHANGTRTRTGTVLYCTVLYCMYPYTRTYSYIDIHTTVHEYREDRLVAAN